MSAITRAPPLPLITPPQAKEQRAARRGKHVCFRQDFLIEGMRKVTIQAAGHNKKVPLLLVGTYSNMLPGEVHKKVWHNNLADGTTQWYSKTTPQPQMHALYRRHMNSVDIHNKLRQGVVSMADVWQTTDWVERHFAEGLGMWEVNVYKALQYFQAARWKGVSHSEFRSRLAFTLMTLGKAKFPSDLAGRTAGFTSPPPNTTNCPPPAPREADEEEEGRGGHEWVSSSAKTCSYCGKQCRRICLTCKTSGYGLFFACAPGTGRVCMAKHANNETATHSSWSMSASGKTGMKQRRSGSRSQSDTSQSESEREHPQESPNSVSRRSARADARGPIPTPESSNGDSSSSSSTQRH